MDLSEKHQLFDVVIVVENLEIKANKNILILNSEYFAAMFSNFREKNQNKIHLYGLPSTGVRDIINYFHLSNLNLNLQNVIQVLQTSNYMRLSEIELNCCNYLKNILNFTNCLYLLSVAETLSITILKHSILQFICENFKEFRKHKTFIKLSYIQLEQLLKSDFPVNCSEYLILNSIKIWIAINNYENSQNIQTLFNLIDYNEVNYLDDSTKIIVNKRGVELSLISINMDGRTTNVKIGEIRYFNFLIGTWKLLTTVPKQFKEGYTTEVCNNSIYVLGGRKNLYQPHQLCAKYNILKNSWETLPPLNYNRIYSCSSTIKNSEIIIVGGTKKSDHNVGIKNKITWEKYIIDSNEWLSISTDSAPKHRTNFASTSYRHFVYISGGILGCRVGLINDFYSYDSQIEEWAQLASLPLSLAEHKMICYKNFILALGGFTPTDLMGGEQINNKIYIYNINTNEWKELTSIPTPRSYFGVNVYYDKLYIMGGIQSDVGGTDIIETFDLKLKTWSREDPKNNFIGKNNLLLAYIPKYLNN